MTVRELLEREDFFDAAILRHGFVDYMRDYELIVSARPGTPSDDLHRYLFVGCTEAAYHTRLRPESFVASLPDENVLSGPFHPGADEPEGFIWGVRYSNAYPGWTYVEDGERARHWSTLLGRRMHEVTVETEVFHLRLVFVELRYAFLGRGEHVARDFPISPDLGATAAA